MPGTPRLLHGHLAVTPSAWFAELSAYCHGEGIPADVYGQSPWLQSFERELAELLGHEAAVFMPSGTMAQQIALRIWAERSGTRRVAFHPTSHVEVHEQQGYRHLHGLEAILVGEALRVPTLDDIAAAVDAGGPAEGAPGAILLELPMREIGGQLIPLPELDRIREWSRAREIALHLDGARLYEAAAGYGESLAAIAGRFDSAYLSFYKGVGGLAGALLAGPREFIDEARVWLRRHGGNLVQMTPFTVSAKVGLERRLSRFAEYLQRAREIDALLAGRWPALTLMPSPVQVNMVHLIVEESIDAINARREKAGEATGLLPCRAFRDDPWGRGAVSELYVGEAAMGESDEAIVASFAAMMG